MLKVTLDTKHVKTTFDSNLYDVIIKEGVNGVPSLRFSIPQGDPNFQNLQIGRTYVKGFDTYLNKWVFEGRVYSIDGSKDTSSAASRSVICEGALGYLSDGMFIDHKYTAGTISRTILESIINSYNQYADDEFKFAIDVCEVDGLPELIEFDGCSCYDALKKVFIDTFGWEVRARANPAGGYFIDAKKTFGRFSSTLISVNNVLQITDNADGSDVATAIVPVGGVGYFPGKGKKTRLNLSRLEEKYYSENSDGGGINQYFYHPNGSLYIENTKLTEIYGKQIFKVVVYDDVASEDKKDFDSKVSELEKKALTDVRGLEGLLTHSYSISASDLARNGYSYDQFELGNTHRVFEPFLKIDETLRITEIERKYTKDEVAPTLTVGNPERKASKQSVSAAGRLNKRINDSSNSAASYTDARLDGYTFETKTPEEYSQEEHDLSVISIVEDATSEEVTLYVGTKRVMASGGGRQKNLHSVPKLVFDGTGIASSLLDVVEV